VDPIVAIVRLLLDQPDWSNTAIAARVGCEQRRVRRYRRMLAASPANPATLKDYDAPELRAYLHRRPLMALPDFAALRRAHPGVSQRALWRAYAAQQKEAGERAMSRSNFMRYFEEWSL